ncbi:diaminopimelate decarboxylase [Balneatrix alpica]|uniref:Diaminopimelate decarboxylase n=1 Tax=Balneatrix alpica TaxID=75684 RepID=A0ABV5ZFD7_9GAMM|nr:diaminopimelate decarboxylase [Balneatrix alpica]
MNFFPFQDGQLHVEQLPLSAIAERFGTPCYVYSQGAIRQAFADYQQALGSYPGLICYAVKANSNLGVLNLLARLGAGFDIVSMGELERVLAAGGTASKVVFSGVGKTAEEMRRALEVGVKCFNVESIAELHRLNQVAGEMGVQAPISLRVNPDVDAKTHPYISTGLKENKFGIDIALAPEVYQQAAQLPHLRIEGVDCHIGSQLTEQQPFLDALERLLMLVDTLAEQGIALKHIDIGGGLGVRYRDEQPPKPQDYLGKVIERIRPYGLELMMEPGRSIVANAGVLLTRVNYLKPTEHKDFAVVDAAMNDLIRPSLYSAWQAIEAVQPRSGEARCWDIVGPICETGDFLGKERELVLEEGDLLAIRSAGAYGFVMASNYNTRPRAAEVMVAADQAHLVRARETLAQLWAGESCLPEDAC